MRALLFFAFAALPLAWPPARRPMPRADSCVAPPAASAESLVAAGRYWHALRAAPSLPKAPRPLRSRDALLQLRIAEGLSQWPRVDEILARVRGADTMPEILAIAARQDERAERWVAAAAKYRRLTAMPGTGAPFRAAAAVRLGVVSERAEPRDSVVAAWRRAAQALPDLADWFALHRAEFEPDTALAFASVASARTPGAVERVDEFVARRRLEAGNIRGALDVFLRRGRLLDAARAELALGRRRPARQRADSILLADPTRPAALLAANFLTESFDLLAPAEWLGVARAYRARGDPGAAERYARRAITKRDTSVAVWLELAADETGRGRARAALAILDSAEARPGGPPAHRAASTAIARARAQALGADDRWDDADSLVARLARAKAGDSEVAAAALALANHERSRGTPEAERVWYTMLVRHFGGTPPATVARFRLALEDYAAGLADSAAAGLAAVLASDSAHLLGRAPRYWNARLRLERHDTLAAQVLRAIAAEEPLGYYGVRARELLDDSLRVAPDSTIPPPLPGGFSAARARERIRLLVAVGFQAEARAEAAGWAKDTTATIQVLLAAAAAAAEAGFAREAIALGEAARNRAGLSSSVVHALFPFPYRRVIEAEAAEHCVDPLLMAALIRQESRFDPRARSRRGARGMSQVLPRTGAAMSARLGIRPWDPDLLYVPDFNLHFGARFLEERLTLDSLPVHALFASYDAGPERIARWRHWPEFNDIDLFVERLPIAETRDYVRIVYANYRWYRRVYGAQPGAGR